MRSLLVVVLLAACGGGDDTDSICDDRPDALACDGWETVTLAGWQRGVNDGNVAEAQGEEVWRGAGAFHATARELSQAWILQAGLLTDLAIEELHVRAYVRPAGEARLVGLLDAEPPEDEVVVGVDAAGIPYALFTSANLTVAATEPLPADWSCVELEIYDRGLENRGVVLSVDGAVVAERMAFAPAPPGGLDDLRVGLWGVPEGAAPEVFVDDLVVDTAPVGCDP